MAPVAALGRLYATQGITIRVKRQGLPIMHLKSYCVDGRRFRTGFANFSASGLKHQDNDLMLLNDPDLCACFERDFAGMWSGAEAE